MGPIEIQPLRSRDDLDRMCLIREFSPNIAIASLSSLYASTVVREPRGFDGAKLRDAPGSGLDHDGRLAQEAGLTVAWPMTNE